MVSQGYSYEFTSFKKFANNNIKSTNFPYNLHCENINVMQQFSYEDILQEHLWPRGNLQSKNNRSFWESKITKYNGIFYFNVSSTV